MNEKITTTQAIELFLQTLKGQNFSPKTIRAYGDDLRQFLAWVQSVRVDFDNPKRMDRRDVEAFMHYLAGHNRTGVTRVRKLAAIRKFFAFLEVNKVLQANPAITMRGARREEREPTILYKEQYKALLYEASESPRDYAIIMTFLQTGIRLSELAALALEDTDLENRLLTVRQGKGKRDRQIPLVDDEVKALRNYLRHRASGLVLDEEILVLAKNGTSIKHRRQVRQKGRNPETGQRPHPPPHLRGTQGGQEHEPGNAASVDGTQEEGDRPQIHSPGADESAQGDDGNGVIIGRYNLTAPIRRVS
jgi:site-specific recombinase XerD